MSTLTAEQHTLQSELRSEAENWDEHETDHVYNLMRIAADKIDALTAERDALQAKLELHKQTTAELLRAKQVAEAKLDALEKQYPSGVLPACGHTNCSFLSEYGKVCHHCGQRHGLSNDSQPVPASPKPIYREGCEYLAMQGTVCNKCGEVHK